MADYTANNGYRAPVWRTQIIGFKVSVKVAIISEGDAPPASPDPGSLSIRRIAPSERGLQAASISLCLSCVLGSGCGTLAAANSLEYLIGHCLSRSCLLWGGKQWWDPYETCHRKQFVCRPNSATEALLCPTSTSFIDSYSLSGPFGSTVYNKDFCWKPACKPDCNHTAAASGWRRNNPHPSQSFMMWRLPRDATRSPEYVMFPWKCPPSEEEIYKALTAQYCSTYKCDFMGMPQGYNHTGYTERRLAPLCSRYRVPLSTDTEMRDNYRQPKQKPELMANHSHYSCNTDPKVACRGIVPTVVQRHVHTQQKRSHLSTYDRFCGKRVTNVSSVIRSLLPQELERLHSILPEEEKEAVKTVLRKDTHPNNGDKVNKLPAVVRKSCSLE
ncbi:testis-expressed protein 26-like [Toxotes jaculatrix]|uniref:testis-expressed protein 26-like n=1 Tax=Toxotes jaculatrix TaxID=941984 RepID=UPI001B3A9639|nr:testis-expressed protein 26-like [Toxotes jaculatrix]